MVSASTALGDTVKTAIDTLTVPQSATQIIGIWGYSAGGPGLTTLENQSGMLELESPDINLQPLQLPLDVIAVLTNGAVAFSPRVWAVNIPVKGGAKITGYMTMDMAITVANKGRFGLIFN